MACIDQCVTERFALFQGDCCEVIRGIPSNSVHFSISSPPFGSLYSYTDALQDMSNVRTDGEFFEGMAFLVEELARVMMPGRIVAFHCMNLPRQKSGTDLSESAIFGGISFVYTSDPVSSSILRCSFGKTRSSPPREPTH